MAADAEVWVSDADMSRITAYLGISQDELARRYLKPHARVPGWRLLSSKHIPAEQAGPAAAAAAGGAAGPLHEVCVFLDASGGCSVYGARPLQCSTFPWWPEMLGPEGWIQEPGYECEGLDHPDAPPLDTWAAVRALQQATAADAALQAAKPPGWSVDELYSAVEAGASPLPSHDSG
jgi:Fe-S-cluster containining protein